MKKIFAITLSIAATAMMFQSCSEVEPAQDNGEMRFDVSLPQTRATDSAFETGDKLSLWAVEYNGDTQMPLQIGGNFINNEKLTFDGTQWAAARTLYWSDNACDFYALYPYSGEISSVESQPFSIVADQNSAKSGDALGGYEASDLMMASAVNASRSDGAVQLQFMHLMSKCRVNVIKGPKFEGDIPDDITVHIYNTATDAVVNLTKCTLEKDPFSARKTITMKKLDNQTFEAVVIPQNIELRTPLIEVTMGGIAYLLEYSLSFKPAYCHTIDLTLNTSPDQEQIEISIDPSIQNW